MKRRAAKHPTFRINGSWSASKSGICRTLGLPISGGLPQRAAATAKQVRTSNAEGVRADAAHISGTRAGLPNESTDFEDT